MKSIILTLGLCIIFMAAVPLSSAGGESPVNPGNPVEESAGPITLREAAALALTKNPELDSFSWEIRSREAKALQAGLLPNPDLDVEIENALGTGSHNGFSQAETTIQLSQLIEIGNKRALRVQAASLSKELAGWDYKIKRADVLKQVTKSFTDVLSAQRQIKLTQSLTRLAEKVKSTASARVQAGKVSPIEEIKADVALSSTRIEMERARRELEAARKRLAAGWGSANPRFKAAVGNLYTIYPVPSFESLAERISKNPDVARWSAEIAHRKAVVDREKSKAIPNITVSGGYRRLAETDDNAFVFGLSVPLTIFDRHQGTIQESFHQQTKAEVNQRAAKTRVHRELADAYKELAVAYDLPVALHKELLTASKDLPFLGATPSKILMSVSEAISNSLVIGHNFGRVLAEEDATCVAYFRQETGCVLYRNAEVFRCERVRNLDRLVY